jgi:hypothetical protein
MIARCMMMAEPAVTQIAMMLVALHNTPHPARTSKQRIMLRQITPQYDQTLRPDRHDLG